MGLAFATGPLLGGFLALHDILYPFCLSTILLLAAGIICAVALVDVRAVSEPLQARRLAARVAFSILTKTNSS
jgi:hypothetical protein